jgi:hypothetical protein
MLKIYLRTIKYEIHNENKIAKLNSRSCYVIRDEEIAVPKTIELGAYTDEAHRAYVYSSDVKQKKKGLQAYYYGWPSEVYLEEWKAPNAKLVMHVAYKEDDCSMKELMTLPVTDVIAYLKQEGMNLIIPS